MKSVMDSVCEYLSGCPLLDPKLPVYLDYVDATATVWLRFRMLLSARIFSATVYTR